MRAILKGLLLALFVCALPVACGPRETGEILFLGRVTDPKRRDL
jgi:hypothetical protein